MPKKVSKRAKGSQSVKPIFRIFCEGERTEPLYIRAYIHQFHSGDRRISVENTNKNTPVELVKEAILSKRQGNNNDIMWVVFDREAEAKYPHTLHQQAREKADANGIQIAFSNICFEYWILLHFEFTTSCFGSYDELKKKSKLTEHLRHVGINNYDKALPLLFENIKDKIEDAKQNADRLKRQAIAAAEPGKDAPHFLNPYVDVQDMLSDMKNFLEGKPSVRD